MIRYIGDIHGCDDLYAKALVGCRDSVQVGDFGFGFIPEESLARWPGGDGHHMIRGNHDDPAKAAKHPGFIESGYPCQACGGWHWGHKGGAILARGQRVVNAIDRALARAWVVLTDTLTTFHTTQPTTEVL